MMLRALSVIVLLLVCGEICAQIYQELEIDLNEGASDYGTVVQAYGSGYIIGSRDDCDSTRCSGLLRFDDSNTMLWYSKSEHFSQQRETLSVDNGDIIYSGYDNSEAKDVIISRMSSDGEEKSMIEVTDTRIIQLNIGCAIEYGQFTICGSQVFLEGDSINIYTCMFWYDNDSAELDTFMLTDVKKGGIWDLRVTPDSMLLASYYYEVPGTGSLNWHRRIEKYNRDKELVWVWDKGGLGHLDIANRSSLEVLDNGDIMIEHTHSMDPSTTSSALWCLDSEGNKKWQFDMSHVPTGSEKLYNIRKTANNDIIACGARTDVLAQDTRSGLICRISADGELLWKRTYADTIGPFDLIGGELLDIVELADGSLVATGFKNTRYVDSAGETRRDRDLWILHMDENGCLADRCGNDLTTSAAPLASTAIALYPNPTAGELCFTAAHTGTATVYTYLGESILTEQLLDQDCIDISDIPSGTYILHYVDKVSGKVFTEKIVKL